MWLLNPPGHWQEQQMTSFSVSMRPNNQGGSQGRSPGDLPPAWPGCGECGGVETTLPTTVRGRCRVLGTPWGSTWPTL